MFSHESKIIYAVRRVMPSVVSILAAHDDVSVQNAKRHPLAITKGAPKNGDIAISGGSGFVVDQLGYVLTNKHVVLDDKAVYAIFDQSGERHDARVIARDPIHDLAILKSDTPLSAPPAPLGSARHIQLGASVIAIGNALGEFRSTVSVGVVSGLSRFVTAITDGNGHQERLRGLIQTDAAINPGNSGGPLINLKGEVVGINSAVVFGAQNIGFAIPIDKIKRDLEDLRAYGRIRRPYLGVRYIILNPQLAHDHGFPLDHGALVVREHVPGDHAVIPGSPAERAGILEGDILVTCGGESITKENSLEDILERATPGESLILTVYRDTATITLTLEGAEWK